MDLINIIDYLVLLSWLMNRSLEMLVDVNLVEEGILRLLLAAVYLMSHTKGNDNEASTASR